MYQKANNLPLFLLTLTALFLFATLTLTALSASLRQIYKKDPLKNLKSLSQFFFYKSFHHYFFPRREFEGLFLAATCTLNITRFLYTTTFITFLTLMHLFPMSESIELTFSWGSSLTIILSFIIITFLFGDFIPRILGIQFPTSTLNVCGPIASFFMILAFPITYLFLKISLRFNQIMYFDNLQEVNAQAKQEIMEIIQEANVSTSLDAHEKKLIESVVTFRDRIAREVMVPRVNVISLPAETSIRNASKLLQTEGYSRIPVYRQNVDNVVGVLMYKDVLNKYLEYEQQGKDPKILDASIETIIKNVLYTPETKKISLLLQEFLKRQVHLAIVVDEYGGTEGIVTIEDILEEIVGEIADEYDEKEALYIPHPEGGWIVDARMSILDAEELLSIKIPQEEDYDTIGGYIFHRTGSIPLKGVVLHHDAFDLEIVSSNERCVEKVRIRPVYGALHNDNETE